MRVLDEPDAIDTRLRPGAAAGRCPKENRDPVGLATGKSCDFVIGPDFSRNSGEPSLAMPENCDPDRIEIPGASRTMLRTRFASGPLHRRQTSPVFDTRPPAEAYTIPRTCPMRSGRHLE